jgi:cytochrome bd-type quinol oxidase subunit 2
VHATLARWIVLATIVAVATVIVVLAALWVVSG